MIQTYTPTLSPITGWSEVNAAGGLNDATNDRPRSPDICAFNGKMYVAWVGTNAGLTVLRIYVSEYNPTNGTWTRIDPGTATGINFNASAGTAASPHLCVFNGKLYCTWAEGSTITIRCKVWSGTGTSWTFVDGNLAIGLNKSSSRSSAWPRLISFNSKLYCTWAESAQSGGNTDYQIRCRVYNGNDGAPSWTFVDGNLATGLNKSVTEPTGMPVPVEVSSKLYLIWAENNGSSVSQIRARVYNGNDVAPSWTFVDGNGANGINFNTASAAGNVGSITERYICAFVFSGKLYSLWREADKPHMKVYNGNDGAPSWTVVDGNTANGLIFDTSKSVFYPCAVAPSGWNPHFAWYESSDGRVRAAVYSGDDSAVKRVDVDTSQAMSTAAAWVAMAFLDTLYVVHQISSPSFQLRVLKAAV